MEIGICKQCGKETFIQNKTKCLCGDCVYRNNHGGKSRIQVALEKKAQKPLIFAKKMSRCKVTGERDLFINIWEIRPHYCTNCGKWLGNEPRTYMFSHRIAKGVNGKERLNPDNIDLLCFDCHFARDMQGEEMFNKRSNKVVG